MRGRILSGKTREGIPGGTDRKNAHRGRLTHGH